MYQRCIVGQGFNISPNMLQNNCCNQAIKGITGSPSLSPSLNGNVAYVWEHHTSLQQTSRATVEDKLPSCRGSLCQIILPGDSRTNRASFQRRSSQQTTWLMQNLKKKCNCNQVIMQESKVLTIRYKNYIHKTKAWDTYCSHLARNWPTAYSFPTLHAALRLHTGAV